MNTHKKLFSNLGYSLVELMVVIGIMGLVGLGTATLIKNVFELQRVQESKSGLLEFSRSLQTALLNDANWTATISHASNNIPLINCLIEDNLPPFCASGPANNVIDFDVYTSNAGVPNLIYSPRSSATAGISISGGPCNTYPSLVCPFRIRLTLQKDCFNGQLVCPKPQITITGDLLKAPIDDVVIRKADDRTAANGGVISFIIRRGDNVRYEPFELVQYSTPSAAALTPPASGGGVCPAANSWQIRPLSAEITNVGNNMTFNNAADTFILQPGTYECTISAEGYDQVTGFKIQLSDVTTPANSEVIGSAVTGNDSSATVTGKVQISPTVVSTYQILHYCTTPSDEVIVPSSDMGRPLPNYTTLTVFTRVYCIRTL